VHNDILDVDAFRKWQPQYSDAEFILEDGKYVCGWEVEKMSKSKHNVQNPDDLIDKYGADTLRLYEMFLARWNSRSHGIPTGSKAFRVSSGNSGSCSMTNS
jgi:hypothetical protein